MSLQEISLVGLSSLFTVAAPYFLYFRKKMSREKDPAKHSRSRIFKFISYNLLINSVAYIGFMVTFMSILSKPHVAIQSPYVIILSTLFLIAAAISFYGCGMYITAVIIETLTPPQFRKVPYLKRQFTVTNLFHGPVSHTLMFSGYIVAFALLCILDIVTGPSLSSIPRLFLISGALLGLSVGYAQITNGSAPFQTITGILSALALIILDRVEGWKFTESPVGIYMIGFITTFLILNLYYFTFHWKWKNIWHRSGYREYN